MSNRRRPNQDTPIALLRRRHEAIAASHPGAKVYPRHEPSAWLRQALQRVQAATPCRHIASGVFPLPVSYALWWPDALECVPCAAARPKLDEVEEYTCDRCGVQCDRINAVSMLAGLIHVSAGLCGDCSRREVGP